MAANWMRRTVLVAACASAALLAACGSSTTESAITPDRFIAFGDANSDVGQKGTRYTVNDGSVNNWTLQVTANYGKPLTPVSAGGLSYAVGNARIKAKPDATGDASTPTVTEQIDTFLATRSFTAGDLVIVGAGLSDVTAEGQAVITGAKTRDQMLTAVGQAGRDLAAQVRRLVQAGATHVVVMGSYNLGRSPWAIATRQEALLQDASSRFNEQLLVSIVDLGANVLYIDAALYLNLVTGTPAAYALGEAKVPACTSVDAGAGIGTGAGQVNSRLCTPGTIVTGADYNSYLFADRIHLTPVGHRLLGDYAYNRIRERW